MTLDEMTAQRDALLTARYRGVRTVEMAGRRPREAGLSGGTLEDCTAAVRRGDAARLERTDGHFAAVAREGQTVRLARTLGLPLRYFVAKMFHGPFLVVADRIDRLYQYCCEQKIGWQFDPVYTRMIPAHYLVEIDQIGCPDPNPRYTRFFTPAVGTGPKDVEIELIGARLTRSAYFRAAFLGMARASLMFFGASLP